MGLVAFGLCLSACKSAKKGLAQPEATTPENAEKPKPDKGTRERPVIRPADLPLGRVVNVNDVLRFVVIDFPTGRLPALEQRLSVYRVDQKVGEIRISGPYRGTTVAADILAGEAKFGDAVKPN